METDRCIQWAVKHHVALVLNGIAGTKQTCAQVPGRLHSHRQVTVPLNPQVMAATPKARKAGTVKITTHRPLQEVGGQLSQRGVVMHAL